MSRHLLIVGAGITGLAAAWQAASTPDVDVTVIDTAPRVGGKIATSPLAGLSNGTAIDEGADAFLARVPHAIELCEELGLSDQLVEPSASRAQVWVDGSAKFLPTDTVLGVPVEFESLATCGLLSASGLADAMAETERDWSAPVEDVSIGAFLTERYGSELVRNVVAPLVGGINAGNVDRLSLRAVTPQLAAAAARGGSLTLALRTIRDSAPPPAMSGVFRGLRGGTGSLISALGDQLMDRGAQIITGTSVRGITVDSTGVRVRTESTSAGSGGRQGTVFDATELLLAVPAARSAQILAEVSPSASRSLASIGYSSVALVTLDVPASVLAELNPELSGVLVPRSEGMLTTAVSVGSNKWPHWSEPERVILRASVGNSDDATAVDLDDDELLRRMIPELALLLSADPTTLTDGVRQSGSVRVSRYPSGFAQYEVGHLDLVDSIEADLAAAAPNIRVTGASFRGLGIPACIEAGRVAVRELLGS